jgi:hypothetical protein
MYHDLGRLPSANLVLVQYYSDIKHPAISLWYLLPTPVEREFSRFLGDLSNLIANNSLE